MQDYYINTFFYRASNSDGTGGQGIRPDCGFIDTYPSTCYVEGKSICNGNGYCSNSTSLCTCHAGYYGLTCAVKECPKGYAWFDEATSSVDAHSFVECSNMGTCDRATGTCKCRDGFTGSACDVHDCPRDSDGSPCSGHGTHSLTYLLTHLCTYSLTLTHSLTYLLTLLGWCMSSEHIAYAKGFTYGPGPGYHTNRRTYPSEWDARQQFSCMCSTQSGSNYGGHPRYLLTHLT